MYFQLFGQYYPYPIKTSKGEHVRQYWTCKWALQICSNHVSYIHETAAKLRKQNSVTLAAVCEWIDSSYDGKLNSITEENECLKFEIWIFSKQKHRQFCKSWAKNEPQYELQCILLDKEVLVPGNKFAEQYSLNFIQFEMSKEHKATTSHETDDGCESDDSAFSSSSGQSRSEKRLIQEILDESLENLGQRVEEIIRRAINKWNQNLGKVISNSIKNETECLQLENRRLAAKFETLNEDVKGIEAHQETMLRERFRHLFQKTETIKQLHEETFFKVAQLESTVTESNALVYELHQKVDTLRRTVQQSVRNHSKEKKDASSEYMKIKELLNLMKGKRVRYIETPEYQELLELIETLKIPSYLSNKDKQLRSESSDTDLLSNLSDIDPESTEMSENVTMDLSQTRNKGSVEDIKNYPSPSQLKDVGSSHCFGKSEIQQDQNDSFRNLDPNRPVSPTLEKALLEFEGEILSSDEDLEQDREIDTESSSRGTNDILTCNVQKTDTFNNPVDEDDVKLEGYANEYKLEHAEAKNQPSHETTKPEIKTLKMPHTEKRYSSKEVTVFLKDPEEEEDTFDNDMAMNRRPERETRYSECDPDVEMTLKASGLQKSKPVIRTVKKALRADSPETRLHGLDTIICVDLSASMSNKFLEQIQATIYSFLDIVEDIAIDVGLEENLGLVTFSKETQICVQLTNDYGKIRGAIENLKPSGTSPLHTALSLCRLELNRNGHATCIHEHCIAPRIILFTDGRPTRDLQMDESDSEYAPKDPQTLDDISSFVQQMGSEGIQLLTVGTGRPTNKDFLERLAYLGGGQYNELDNINMLAKYFRDQFIVGKVIHEHRESGWKEDYKAQLQIILNTNTFRLHNEDKERIEELLLQSEELYDSEYPGLPKLGSRVQTNDGRCGTVVRHRKQNWVKIQFDENDEIMYFHFIPNANNNGLQTINLPRRQETRSAACVGLLIYKYDHFNKIKGWGYLYDRTESGYLKVKWEDGSKNIVKANDLYKNEWYRSFDSMYEKNP